MIKLNYIEEYMEDGVMPTDPILIAAYSYLSDSLLVDSINDGLFALHGERELIIPEKVFHQQSLSFDDWLENKVTPYVNKQLSAFFKLKSPEYQKIYDALTAEYNPLYNVDGTEQRSYTKDNTGTQGNDTTKTGNIQDNLNYVGTETNTNTETGNIIDNNVKNGTMIESTNYEGAELSKNTKSGSESLSKQGGDINSTTTFDTQTPQETTRTIKAPSTQDTTTFNNVTDSDYKVYGVDQSGQADPTLTRQDTKTTSFQNYSDQNTRSFGQDGHINNEVKTFTGRSDNKTTTFNNVKDSSLRTDLLKEQYTETLKRFGNIGVTKSTDLIESEVLLRQKYNMSQIICKDIANFITYGC